jgi:hypothetical protein
MSFTLDIPEDIGGASAYLDASGQFHSIVKMVHEEAIPKDNDGFTPVPGGFSVELEVAAGDHDGKKFSLIFWGPKLDKADDDKGNVWSRKKQAAFLLASDCISLDQMGKKGVSIDLQDAVGAQIIVDVEMEQYTDSQGKSRNRPQLVWANIYHVDDPRAKSITKNEKLLATIPKEQRHPGEYFAPLMKKAEKKAAPPTRLTNDQLDDL